MENLPIEYLKISAGQWLSDTEKFRNGTPSNYIIFKRLCGLGATHGECLLYDSYNAIILEPNTPVLIGKRDARDNNGNKIYPNILVVFKEQNENDVIEYLKGDIHPKKILCTPEAYATKVVPAIEKAGLNLFEDFFMLIDECDRMTKDVEYRESIIKPMDDFFKFKKKAMISATAMQPSDPRFAQGGFKILKIQPDYNFEKPVRLIHTNNILGSLDVALKNCKSDRIFIFLNGTNLIHATIKSLRIERESKVFCSEKSVKKLFDMNFLNTSSELGDYSRINLMTSRFFSAVDIKIEDKPDIIIITDVMRSQHTMVDPYSDCTQIIGRFRNGYNSVAHITNCNVDIEFKGEDNAKKYINDGVEQYKMLLKVKADLLLREPKDLTVINQAVEDNDFKRFFKQTTNELLYFLLDNFYLDQQIKSYYVNIDSLEEAYLKTGQLKPIVSKETFNFSDQLVIALKESERNLIETISTAVNQLEAPLPNGIMRFNLGRTVDDFRKNYPEILEVYDSIGYQKMKYLSFDKIKMRNYVLQLKRANSLNNPNFIKEIKLLYNQGDKILTNDVEAELSRLYRKYNIDKTAKSSHIVEYYDAKPSTIDWIDPETLISKKRKIWKINDVKP